MKEKEYKAARNMYLVGFALTLLFVIGRITELMHEHAQLQGRLENLRLAASMMETDETQHHHHHHQQKPIEESGTAPENDSPVEGIEMKPMGLKKRD
mmetsp:Transcript_21118/g.47690  ORF Transcript_21118/g.47690 Transcript_21118/m.47690 type:complete len:97 (-) Transcript_21118:353-643(-)